MTHSKDIALTSSRSTASARSRLAAFTLLALAPLGCTLQSGDEAQADELEQVGESADALTAGFLPAPLTAVPVEIRNVNSGKCLDIAGLENGSPAQQYDCHGGTNQTFELFRTNSTPTYFIQGARSHKNLNVANPLGATNANANVVIGDVKQGFMFERQSNGTYLIAAVNGNKCFDIGDGSLENNAPLQQYDCHGGNNQRWYIVARTTPKHLQASHSGSCIDVSKASTADGANVVQFSCRAQPNQKWSMGATTIVDGASYFSLVANHSGKCMEVLDGSPSDGAKVQQATCNNGDSQKWEMVNANGWVGFQNKRSRKCLDVPGGATDNNVSIQQYACHLGKNQLFSWY
jgi:hypothetical protein